MISFLLAAVLMGPPQAVTVPVEQIADRTASCITWVVGAGAADLYSTSWALARCPSCREANPLGFNSEARIGLKMASGAAFGLACYALERKGHPGWAKIVKWTYVGLTGFFVGNNVFHGARRR